MPFTFFAHQAPVLPLSERHPERWDGVALVVGSMAPDLAYVTRGWGYGPDGIHLWFDGHRLQNVLVVAVASCAVAWVVRRIVMPVAPLVVPDGGVLHLRDYRYLAEHRHRWWIVLWSALVGALTHLVLDAFTHPDGFVVEHVGALQGALFSIGGRTLHVYAALQLGGTVLLSVIALWSLVGFGRSRHFRPASGDRPLPRLPSTVVGAFWGVVAVGCALGVAYAVERGRTAGGFVTSDSSTVVISFCWVAFIGLVVACLLARPFVPAPGHDGVEAAGGAG